MHSILLLYNSKVAARFATRAWLIWFACNQLKHEGSCPTVELIAHQALQHFEEYLRLHRHNASPTDMRAFCPPQRLWCPPNLDFLKVNFDFAFSEGRIGIGILVRNHLGIPLLLKLCNEWALIL